MLFFSIYTFLAYTLTLTQLLFQINVLACRSILRHVKNALSTLSICSTYVACSSLCTFVSKTFSVVNETSHRRTCRRHHPTYCSVFFFCIELRCKKSLTEKSLFCRQSFRRFARSRLQTKACSCAQRSVFYFEARFGADIIDHVCTLTHTYCIWYVGTYRLPNGAHCVAKTMQAFRLWPTNCIQAIDKIGKHTQPNYRVYYCNNCSNCKILYIGIVHALFDKAIPRIYTNIIEMHTTIETLTLVFYGDAGEPVAIKATFFPLASTILHVHRGILVSDTFLNNSTVCSEIDDVIRRTEMMGWLHFLLVSALKVSKPASKKLGRSAATTHQRNQQAHKFRLAITKRVRIIACWLLVEFAQFT